MFIDSVTSFIFGPVLRRLARIEEITMGNIQLITELADKVEQLTTAAKAANDKSDALIVLVGDLRKQVADLAGTGGATASQLRAILAKADAGIAEAVEQKAQNEAALVEPAPEPDPGTDTSAG